MFYANILHLYNPMAISVEYAIHLTKTLILK